VAVNPNDERYQALIGYKQVPDWLNARFWANPENFGKYWW
ncbi:MAG: DUF6231 family protein, partial [Gammaproteobacteria bacterium]